jgi:PAS domain S-box-containing protein
MGIDIRTLILITGISYLMQVLVFLHQYKANRNIMGPGWWLLWSAVESFGFVLILLREVQFLLPVIIVFQDILLLTGAVFIYVGVMRFFDKKANLKFIFFYLTTFIILHLFFIFIKNDIQMRALVLDVYLSGIAFITAVELYRNKTDALRSAVIFNVSLFIVHGSIFAYRSVMILNGTSIHDVFSPSMINLLQYFDALIVSLLWTFGFIIMLNQRLNAEISETKNHFELIFNTSPDAAIISRMSDSMIIGCNESFTRITGYTMKDVSGKSTLDINVWHSLNDRMEFISMISENGIAENFESLFRLKNGKVITGLMSARKILIKGIPHILSVTRDISERKFAEEEIKLQNDRLQTLIAEKDKFFSIIAHDLRSPFNSFLGLTQIMVEDLPDLTMDDLKIFTFRMKDSAVNLYRLLENLLDWSGMKTGIIQFKPVTVNLNIIAEESMAPETEQLRSKSIELVYDIPGDIMVFADVKMLQSVLINLVSNAVKFTHRGGSINISAKRTSDNTVIVSIKDTGIGMTPEMVSNLFRIDFKINRKGTEGEPSTGLGLLLCKEFIEKQGGTIRVESEEGKGSVFSFSLNTNRSS